MRRLTRAVTKVGPHIVLNEYQCMKHTFELRAGERLNRRKILAVIYATLAVAKRKPEENSGLNGIRTHDLCDAGAVLTI